MLASLVNVGGPVLIPFSLILKASKPVFFHNVAILVKVDSCGHYE